jgi:hypothetical protein
VGDKGLESWPEIPENRGIDVGDSAKNSALSARAVSLGGATSSAVSDPRRHLDPQLLILVNAWPRLRAKDKQTVMRIVKKALTVLGRPGKTS